MFDLNNIRANSTPSPQNGGKAQQELLDFLDKHNVVSRRLLISPAGVRDSFLDPVKLSAFCIEWRNGMRLHTSSPDYATQMILLKHKIKNVIAFCAMHFIGDVAAATLIKKAIGTKGTMEFNDKVSKVLSIMRPALQVVDTIFPPLQFPLVPGKEVLSVVPSVKLIYSSNSGKDENSTDIATEISSTFAKIAKANSDAALTLEQERELNILTTMLSIGDNNDYIFDVLYVDTSTNRLISATTIDPKVASSERNTKKENLNDVCSDSIEDLEKLFRLSNVKLTKQSKFDGIDITKSYDVDDTDASVHAAYINSPVTIAELIYLSNEGFFAKEIGATGADIEVDLKGIGQVGSALADNLCNLLVLVDGKNLYRYMPHAMQYEYKELVKAGTLTIFNAHTMSLFFGDRFSIKNIKAGQLAHYKTASISSSDIAYKQSIGLISDSKINMAFLNVQEFFAVGYKNDEIFTSEIGGSNIDKERALMAHFEEKVIPMEYIDMLLQQISSSVSGRAVEARKFAAALNDAKNRDSVAVQEFKAIVIESTPDKITYERVFTNDNTPVQVPITALDVQAKNGKISFNITGEYEDEKVRIKSYSNDEHPELTMAMARVDRGDDQYVVVSDISIKNPTRIEVEQMDLWDYDINIDTTEITGCFTEIIDGIHYGEAPSASLFSEVKVADILPSNFMGVSPLVMFASEPIHTIYSFSYLNQISLPGIRFTSNKYKSHKSLRVDESIVIKSLSPKYKSMVNKIINTWINKKKFKQVRFDDDETLSRSVRAGYKLSDFMKISWETRLFTQPIAYDSTFLLIGQSINDLRTYSRMYKEIRNTKFTHHVHSAHAFNLVKAMINEKYFFRLFSTAEFFDYADASQLNASIAKYQGLLAAFKIHEKISIHFLLSKKIIEALDDFTTNKFPEIMAAYTTFKTQRAAKSSDIEVTRNSLYRLLAMTPVALWTKDIEAISVEMSTLKTLIEG